MIDTYPRCVVCGRPITKSGHKKYCDSIYGNNIKRFISPVMHETIRVLVERGDIGMRAEISCIEFLFDNNWLVLDDDGYYRLSNWGNEAVVLHKYTNNKTA